MACEVTSGRHHLEDEEGRWLVRDCVVRFCRARGDLVRFDGVNRYVIIASARELKTARALNILERMWGTGDGISWTVEIGEQKGET